MFKRTLLLTAIAAVAAAAPAQAGVERDLAQPDMAIVYNGHAGLGASAYQHHQTDLEFLTDGTSNTIMFG